jgi:signal recognition particle GTPase
MTCNLSMGKQLWMLFSLQDLSIPVKFAGTGEGLNDFQPFDVEALMSCSFP